MNAPSNVYVWTAIVGLMGVVFVTRNAFLGLPARWRPRGAFERALRFAPLSALVALTVPGALGAFVDVTDAAGSPWTDARLPAAVVTIAVARLARSPVAGLLIGLAVLVGLEALA